MNESNSDTYLPDGFSPHSEETRPKPSTWHPGARQALPHVVPEEFIVPKHLKSKTHNDFQSCLLIFVLFFGIWFGGAGLLYLLFHNSSKDYFSPSDNDGAASHYQKEIRDGVRAYDPLHQLTPREEAIIKKAAEEVAKEYPKYPR